MHLSHISLLHFRNHEAWNVKLDQDQTIIVGANGAGKTNILEAIYLLSSGDSFREAKSEEMVSLGQEVAHVAGKLGDDTNLQVSLSTGVVQDQRTIKKRYLVNGVPRSKSKFVGHLLSVVFRPEDLRLVEGNPARRRKFLDEVLSQADRSYAVSLGVYTKAIRQRNKLLVMIREGQTTAKALEYWDSLVIKHGSYLNQERQRLVEEFNSNRIQIEVETEAEIFASFEMSYDHSLMSRQRLDQYKMQELASGHTLVGPHRDDFVIKSQVTSNKQQAKQDLAIYGSRGQQRLGVLWLKLQALDYLETKSGERPLLLLDDIFSELDHEHRRLVFDLMGRQQTIATTADSHYLKPDESMRVITLDNDHD